MAAYKDEKRGTWYVSFHYYDWTGKNCRKVKRGFKTKREATEWEHHFRMKEASDLDMTFGEFVEAYTRDKMCIRDRLLIPLILLAYSLSDITAQTARTIMYWHCASACVIWPISFILPSTLRAAGDAKVTMVISRCV